MCAIWLRTNVCYMAAWLAQISVMGAVGEKAAPNTSHEHSSDNGQDSDGDTSPLVR